MKTGTSSACLGDRMRIINRSPSEWRLRVETVDDLWVLANVVRPGTGLAMLGERRDQTTGGEAGGRAKQAERKKMWIRLNVEHTEHQAFSETLRVHGIIEEAAFDVGLHHTHVVDLRDEVVVTAHPSLPQVDRDLLLQSEAEAAQGQVALLVVEHDEMILFFVTGRGLRESATWTMRGGGKRGDIRQSEGVAAAFEAPPSTVSTNNCHRTCPWSCAAQAKPRTACSAICAKPATNEPCCPWPRAWVDGGQPTKS